MADTARNDAWAQGPGALTADSDGTIRLTARAWAVRGKA
jgi:hypothetical protein